MGCEWGSFPISYLGLPVGGSMKRVASWKPVIEKMKAKLVGWKAKILSSGGRLTLVKSVLGSLPLYYLSLFRAPSGVIKQLESIRCRFFQGVRMR